MGARRAPPKYVTIYKTTSAKVAKGQPAKAGGATVKGWTKVSKVRTDGLGKYRKGSIVPRARPGTASGTPVTHSTGELGPQSPR